MVSEVKPKSQAERFGVEKNWVIVKVDGKDLRQDPGATKPKLKEGKACLIRFRF